MHIVEKKFVKESMCFNLFTDIQEESKYHVIRTPINTSSQL